MKQEYLDIYPTLYRNHWWWRARERVIVSLLERHLGTGGPARLLDVGCGEGLLFPVLTKFGTVEGVDPCVGEEKARSLNIHPVPFDETAPLAGSYDAILMLDFLEHLDDPCAALKAAHRFLAPGAKLFVTVPAFDLLWTSHDDLNEHERRYTRSLLEKQVCESGFKVEECSYFFHWVFFVKLLVRLKESLFPPKTPKLAGIPPANINAALRCVSIAEYGVLEKMKIRIPVGGSVLLVATRQ